MAKTKKAPILQGSLDLLVLQALKKEALHGYAISRHLTQASKEYLQIEEGSLYPALIEWNAVVGLRPIGESANRIVALNSIS